MFTFIRSWAVSLISLITAERPDVDVKTSVDARIGWLEVLRAQATLEECANKEDSPRLDRQYFEEKLHNATTNARILQILPELNEQISREERRLAPNRKQHDGQESASPVSAESWQIYEHYLDARLSSFNGDAESLRRLDECTSKLDELRINAEKAQSEKQNAGPSTSGEDSALTKTTNQDDMQVAPLLSSARASNDRRPKAHL